MTKRFSVHPARLAAALPLMLAACIPRIEPPVAPAPPPIAWDTSVTRTGQDVHWTGDGSAAPVVTTPVVANAPAVAPGSYVVRAGDTLRGIGNRTGAGSEMIAKANGLAPPYVIHPGQKLDIPGGRYHLVEPGQTGLAIALAYGVSWQQIVETNGLEDPFVLRTGQRLRLPDPPSRALSPEERAAAFHLDIEGALSGSEPAGPEQAASARAPAASSPAPVFGRLAWPVAGHIIAHFGKAANGVRNSGIDISVPAGTAVRAAADGVVTFASDQVSLFGGLILIDHGAGWRTAYGYVSRVDVQTGQRVKRGTAIALSGDSGLGSQPKLHFELRQNRTAVDPLSRLEPR